MIKFLSLFIALGLMATPVLAQDATEAVEAGTKSNEDIKSIETRDANPTERLALAEQMHEIWPIRQKIENALDVISERLPQQERMKFKTTMRQSMDFDELKKTSIESMADIFSKAELEKMIEFYGSKEGRSISFKTGDYEKALQPVMMKMLDKALLDAKLGASKSGGQSFPNKK